MERAGPWQRWLILGRTSIWGSFEEKPSQLDPLLEEFELKEQERKLPVI